MMTNPRRIWTNPELAEVFQNIADLLDIKGENIYKVLAYRRAVDNLNELGEDINDVWRAGKLTELPGMGKAIAEKINELLTTGQLTFLDKLKEEIPISLLEMLRVPGVGPRKAALFWRQAAITGLAGMEAAARAGKLRQLPGMGEKSEASILAGIQSLRRRSGRIPLGRAWPLAQELLAFLRSLPGVTAAEAVGSLRRMCATVGGIDLAAAAADPRPVLEAFSRHPKIVDQTYKVSETFRIPVQLWVQPPDRFGSLLQWTTGSKAHNARLHDLAISQGLLSPSQPWFFPPAPLQDFNSSPQSAIRNPNSAIPTPQSAFPQSTFPQSTFPQPAILNPQSAISFPTEQDLYQSLGLPWIPPELREDRGEIDAARQGCLPNLVRNEDLVADLHCHTTWSDGRASIQVMAETAIQRGLRILAITDHTYSLGVVQGLTAEDVVRQRAEIDAVQRQVGDQLLLLQGSEVEIRADGSLDFPDEVLASLDFVIASIHTSLRQPRDVITARLLKAIRNPHVHAIGHPTGGLLPDRQASDLDMDAVFAAAARCGVALEINANPSRLDLSDVHARQAAAAGVRLTINRDAHFPEDVGRLEFGVATARRGWIEAHQVLNTLPAGSLISWLKSRGLQKLN
jgi:DNA polymerase (family 10)